VSGRDADGDPIRRPEIAMTNTPIAAAPAFAADWRFPQWIAHRGAGKLAPENTLAAFRVGASHGYRAFECDARLSADGVAFLLHDTTLQRTTAGSGIASQLDWDALSQIDAGAWHSREFAGERLPSLAAVCRYVVDNGFALNVEIKPTPGDELRTGEVVAAQAWAALRDTASPLLLSSFSVEALAAAMVSAPDAPRALLIDKAGPAWLAQAQSLRCVAVVFDHRLIDVGVVTLAHEAGLRVLAYTVNSPAEAARLQHLGACGLITDAVDKLSALAAPI
jgi:glycerophosphoryl diester phosphodiesterase